MKSLVIIALMAILSVSVYATPFQYSVRDLGTPDSNFTGIALNADGHVIGAGGEGFTARPVAYRDGLLDLSGLFPQADSGRLSTLWGLNDKDNIIGGITGVVKFYNAVTAQTFSFPANVMTLTAINNHDAVIGYQKDQNGTVTPFYFDGDYHSISVASGAGINGLNDAGQLTGQAQQHAILMNRYDAAVVDLGTFGGAESNAFALNSHGHVTGQAEHQDQSTSAFYYDGKKLADIGTLGGESSIGLAINSADIVVGSADVVVNSERIEHAFYYDGQIYDLNDYLTTHTWTLSVAKGINDQNQILADGYDAQGNQHMLLLTPVNQELLTASANQQPTARRSAKKADVAVSVKSSVSKAVVGKVFSAVVTAGNVGWIDTTQNVLAINLDPGSTLVGYDATGGTCSHTETEINCVFSSLKIDAKKKITVKLLPKLPGAVTTRATIASQETDGNLSNNTAKLLTAVVDAPTQPGPTPPPGDPAPNSWYKPGVGATWQWQLSGTVNPNYVVDIYDIDLFDASSALINNLKNSGKKVICYFSAGSSENWRSNFSAFLPGDMGKALDGWAGEKWLDIRSANVYKIMLARLDLAKSKGCDGVEPDNVDGYANSSGFSLSANDQLTYNKKLAEAAHARGLAIALKNDLDQANQLVDFFDFSVNEQCYQYNECAALNTFIAKGKPVFNVEYQSKYVNNATTRQSLCNASLAAQFSTLILPLNLDDKFRYSCR